MNATPSFFRSDSTRRASAFTTTLVVLSLVVLEGAAVAQESGDGFKTASEAFGEDALALLDAGRPKGDEVNDAGMTTPLLLSALPAALDFGDLEVGFNTTRMLTLSNDGDGTVRGSVVIFAPFSVTEGGEFSLGPGEVHEVTVDFAPESRGTNPDFLSFVVDEVVALEVRADGRGVAPILFLEPPLLDFRVVRQGETGERFIRIANAGELMLDGVAQVPPPFFLSESARQYSLGEGESTLLPVEFRPVDAGVHDTTLLLVGDQSAEVSIRAQSVADVGQFRGQVVDLLNDLPIICAAIHMRNDNGFETVATTDSSGVFVSEEIPQGSYDLTIHAPGYERPTVVLDLLQGLVEHRFSLQPRAEDGAVRGVVGDAFSGALLGGVKVTVLQRGNEVATAYTCAKGSFEFRLLDREQPITLAFAAPGYDQSGADGVVNPPFDRTLSFVLMPEGAAAGEIFGTVTDRGSGEVVSMAVITATRLGVARTIFSGGDGRFDLSGIASGHYRIRVSAAGHLAEIDLEATVFGADPPAAFAVALVSGLDEVDAPPADGDPAPTGCAAGATRGQSAPWDFILVLVAVAVACRHAQLQRPKV